MKRHSSTLDEIDAAAAEWVARRDAGLDGHEEVEFERWCAASVLHAEAVARFSAIWTSLGRPRRTGGGVELVHELRRRRRQREQRRLGIAGAALAVVLAAGWGGMEWWKPAAPPAQAVVHVPTRRILPDGSVIEHPAGAEVNVAYSGTVRRVILGRGEAHFSVLPDPSRPVIVDAAGVVVQAVGTVFSVELGGEEVEVLVTEGTVAVAKSAPVDVRDAPAPASAPLALVGAGHRLVVGVALQPVDLSAPQSVSREEFAGRLAWRSRRVEFSGAPLAEVLTVLNRYNREQFVLGDSSLAKVPLSGLFRADDVEAFTRMLETGFGIAVERRDGLIELRKSR
jgi:transmembrane sensor